MDNQNSSTYVSYFNQGYTGKTFFLSSVVHSLGSSVFQENLKLF